MSTTTFRTNLLQVAHAAGDHTVMAIADTTGLDHGSISRYLASRRLPRLERLQAIARAYRVPVDRLLQEPTEASETENAA